MFIGFAKAFAHFINHLTSHILTVFFSFSLQFHDFIKFAFVAVLAVFFSSIIVWPHVLRLFIYF